MTIGARPHANKDIRFVATLADMSAWLMLLNAGLFSNGEPYADGDAFESSA